MLKLTVSPGDFIMIGEDIKVIIGGGEKANIPIAIDAPRDRAIIRSSAKHRIGFANIDKEPKPYVEKTLSDEAKKKITAIVNKDRWEQRQKDRQQQ